MNVANMTIEIADNRTFFWQWDTGCRLRVVGIEESGQVHFYRDGMTEPLHVSVYKVGEDVVCDIPDEILQIPKKFAAYTYVIGEFGSKTYISKTFMVESRPKPANYIYTPTEKYTVEQAVKEAIDKIKDGILSAVIDVDTLPTENINREVLYRKKVEPICYVIDEGVRISDEEVSVITVDTLPEVGIGLSQNVLYVKTSDLSVWAYADEATASEWHISTGWHLTESVGVNIPVISSPEEATDTETIYIVYTPENYRLYHYAKRWIEIANKEDIPTLSPSTPESDDEQIIVLEYETATADEIRNACDALRSGVPVYLKDTSSNTRRLTITTHNIHADDKACYLGASFLSPALEGGFPYAYTYILVCDNAGVVTRAKRVDNGSDYYASKGVIGDIETALDGIISLQSSLIGGES